MSVNLKYVISKLKNNREKRRTKLGKREKGDTIMLFELYLQITLHLLKKKRFFKSIFKLNWKVNLNYFLKWLFSFKESIYGNSYTMSSLLGNSKVKHSDVEYIKCKYYFWFIPNRKECFLWPRSFFLSVPHQYNGPGTWSILCCCSRL